MALSTEIVRITTTILSHTTDDGHHGPIEPLTVFMSAYFPRYANLHLSLLRVSDYL